MNPICPQCNLPHSHPFKAFCSESCRRRWAWHRQWEYKVWKLSA